MKNLFLFCFILLFASASFGDDALSASVFVRSAKAMEIPAQSGGIEFIYSKFPSPNSHTQAFFYKEGKAGEWTDMKFSFIPSERFFTLFLEGKFIHKKGGVDTEYAVAYTDVRINGEPVVNGDFSRDFFSWSELPSGGFLPAVMPPENVGEKSYAVVSRSARIFKRAAAEPGKPVEISLKFKPLGVARPAEDIPLDISSICNAKLGSNHSEFEIPGAFKSPLPSKDGFGEFGGVKFLTGKTGENGDVVVFSKSCQHEYFYLPKNIKTGRYLYMLISGARLSKGKFYVIVEYLDGNKSITVFNESENISDYKKEEPKLNARPVYKDGGVLYLSKVPLRQNCKIKRLRMFSTNDAEVLLAAVSLSHKEVSTTVPKTTDPEEFKPVDMEDLSVKEGSALYFGLPDSQIPAGKFGRTIVNSRGRLAFEKDSEREIKFFGYNSATSRLFVKGDVQKTRENCRRRAAAIRAQGYNAVNLWIPSSKTNPEMRDTVDFFISELKRNGIYIQYRLVSPDLGQPNYTFETRDETKLRCILCDPEMLSYWRAFVLDGLARKNPYTGMSLAEDPAVISVNFFGEMNSGYERLVVNVPYLIPYAKGEWVKWLRKKYGDISRLNAAWKPNRHLESFDDVNIPEHIYRSSKLSQNDWYRFMADSHSRFNSFCRGVLAEAGYKGLVYEGDGSRRMSDTAMRARDSDICAIDIYYCHPHGGWGEVGCSVSQKSCLETECSYFRDAMSTRINNRPFIVMEYNYCHWNPYVYEGGLIFPAYGAFQGWSQLFIHADAVIEKPAPIASFSAGSSPVMRANEVLAKLLFWRGDVSESKHSVDLVLSKKWFDLSADSCMAMNPAQTKISLMTGFATSVSDIPSPQALKDSKPRKASVRLAPSGSGDIFASDWFSDVLQSKDSKFDIDDFAELLKKRGILSNDNVSSPKDGVYQTDTGEITLRSKEGLLKVVTPRTEAVAMRFGRGEKLGRLEVVSSGTDALVSISSLDAKPISESSRLLLIYSTEARNTGQEFSFDGSVLLKGGTLPVRMKVGKLNAYADLDEGEYVMYPLRADGLRREPIALKREGTKVKIDLDTSKLKNGVTPFFEIVKK